MQSLSRAIRRGNAVMIYDNVHKTIEVVQKKGTEHNYWNWAFRNKLEYSMQNYCENVSKPYINKDKVIKRRRKRQIV